MKMIRRFGFLAACLTFISSGVVALEVRGESAGESIVGDVGSDRLRTFELPSLVAQQQPRGVALVIGNQSYRERPLANPVNDATAIHQKLESLGFEVLPLTTDASKEEMVQALRDFRNRLRKDGVAVFYYAGHGIEANGENYLIPVGADMDREEEAEFEALPLWRVLRAMEAAETRINVLFIDACRDNRWYRRWRSTRGGRRGLTSIRPSRGTLIAYATEPGTLAEDGKGSRHSPFTASLLNHLGTPGLDVDVVLDRVAEEVLEATNNKQFPWSEGQIVGDFSFAPGEVTSSPTPSQPISEPPTPSQPPEPELPPVVSPQFRQLASYLDAGQWRAADQENTRLMLGIANRESEDPQPEDPQPGSWLQTTDVDNIDIIDNPDFECEALREIDSLWVHYSQGHFGFSIQSEIYRRLGGTREYNREIWHQFGDVVRWRVDGDWLTDYSQLNFSLRGEKGHLPSFFFNYGLSELLPNTRACQL